MAKTKSKSRRINKSKILKRYEIAYENCIKKAMKGSARLVKKKSPKKINKSKKHSPTQYQKFVKKHSKDMDITGLSPSSRMRKIAKLWKKEKKLKSN